ncbi:MAG: hypothetical protein ACREJB_11400, partial [Planctomycetaceae bacterium]
MYRASPAFAAVIRGQTPSDLQYNDQYDYDESSPQLGTPGAPPPLVEPGLSPGGVYQPPPAAPFSQGPMNYDPFLGAPPPTIVNPGVYPGVNGPQPYKFGWVHRVDA